MNRFRRLLAVMLLVVATLGFGGSALCGAVFTALALATKVSPPRGENYIGGALIYSVPSLLVGGAVAWWCICMLRRVLRS